jgi:hypothetical protein
MVESVFTSLLIPLIPAMAFMIWVIWALEKQIGRDKHHRDAITHPKG